MSGFRGNLTKRLMESNTPTSTSELSLRMTGLFSHPQQDECLTSTFIAPQHELPETDSLPSTFGPVSHV
jgi:hypothetical protein